VYLLFSSLDFAYTNVIMSLFFFSCCQKSFFCLERREFILLGDSALQLIDLIPPDLKFVCFILYFVFMFVVNLMHLS
jgi:hypothetical protein